MITVVANLKGGSGKSSLVFNLGLWLQTKGQPVAAYDLDPQRTLLDIAEVRRDESYTPPLQVHGYVNDLAKHLQQHPGEVLIDVGASNLEAAKAALAVADRIVVPVPPSQPDVWATQRFLRLIQEAAPPGHAPEVIVFVNRADTNRSTKRESDDTEAALRELASVTVLPNRLCQRTVYRYSMSEGLSIMELAPKGKAAREFEEFAYALYPALKGVGKKRRTRKRIS